MILRTMLQRLYASLIAGPGLNAKPHNSRQRVDLLELRHLQGTEPATVLGRLIEGKVEFPAKVAEFSWPSYPESEWSEEQRNARTSADKQGKVLGKLRDIAEDSMEYYNDHGEQALFVGFPLLSIPVTQDRQGFKSSRILAPIAFVPVTLNVRRGLNPGVTLEVTGEGADLVMPNPGLLAWIEQQTGQSTEALFADEEGKNPWREIAETIALAAKAAGIENVPVFDENTVLQTVPRTDALPTKAEILPCAILGLFPLVNPGLLRDTKWMQEQEPKLVNPVQAFLSPKALEEAEANQLPEAKEWDHEANTGAKAKRDFSEELLVTHADPCQAEAVAHARRSAALVIHGPPGTGKSQTIANIIGDHLARGERVLFVCDKRTALDVVKYRLESMGLGGFCGVIHDPQKDRTQLYMHVREKLEELAQAAELADPAKKLNQTNSRLNDLHAELRGYFDRLHGCGAEGESFHQLVGEWWLAREKGGVDLPEVEGLSTDDLVTHRTDAEEILKRAIVARWPESPYRGRLGMTLSEWLASRPAEIKGKLEKAVGAAKGVDETLPGGEGAIAGDLEQPVTGGSALTDGKMPAARWLVALEPSFAAREQAEARNVLADLLDAVVKRGLPEVALKLAASTQWQRFEEEISGMAKEAERLGHPLERELYLQVKGAVPSLGEVGRRLLALDNWAPIAGSWTRFFAFAKKKEASLSLTPLALPLTPEATERARKFYLGLKARYLWSDLQDRLLGKEAPTLPTDEELLTFRDGLPEVITVLKTIKQPVYALVQGTVLATLQDLNGKGTACVAMLRQSAKRADAIHGLEVALMETGVFTGLRGRVPGGEGEGNGNLGSGVTGGSALTAGKMPAAHWGAAIGELSGEWRKNKAATEICERFVEFFDTLEEAIRLTDRHKTLSAPMQEAVSITAVQGMPWETAEPALKAAVLSREIRKRLREDEALARIDTKRVEAAFAELLERTEEKKQVVRASVLHRWQKVWRERLLASTGSRLNTLGASLRQRLFVRGERAMKLRQMIASGAGTEGGDPLFDLCPVWMASPATVAQIFPREALFDVVMFDEASQCRLEEALPVLLRGKRVVIAGDPKQLPPTRFFEQALADSEDTAAETAEEVFVQQQSEAEDLLTAALNLNVQEAFLDVHYRSRNEALIGFSNESFYAKRLQPIPGHPQNRALSAPIRLVRVDGLYKDRGNEAEAKAAAELVVELLDDKNPPSIGVACFNLNQRDLILEALDEKAATDARFAQRLEAAKKRRGNDSFEGLFVKNLENVQGDERDHMIICTTFGLDANGKFRRNFGALSRSGGERRLNVLVTRARAAIHILTSIPRAEYISPEQLEAGQRPTGRHFLYDYLRYAEGVGATFERWQNEMEQARGKALVQCVPNETTRPSTLVEAVGGTLHAEHEVGSTLYWGNDGFCVDVALTHPELGADVTLGVLADFTRYQKTPDPISWEQFRSMVLSSQGWKLHRLWSPALFRDGEGQLGQVVEKHLEVAGGITNDETKSRPDGTGAMTKE
ncbi:MAG TPA: AAA domain-containing protein [Verrucomicrobiae bacterium]